MKLVLNWYENYIELLLMSDNYLNDSDFLLVIVDLLLIIGVITEKNMSC